MVFHFLSFAISSLCGWVGVEDSMQKWFLTLPEKWFYGYVYIHKMEQYSLLLW